MCEHILQKWKRAAAGRDWKSGKEKSFPAGWQEINGNIRLIITYLSTITSYQGTENFIFFLLMIFNFASVDFSFDIFLFYLSCKYL